MRQPRYRKARREQLNQQGIQPANMQRAVCVRVINTKILPAWLSSRLIPGLGSTVGVYWLKHSDAAALMYFFRTITVWYSASEVQFKRCPNCFRPLVGNQADAIRLAMETTRNRTELKCGADCDKDNELGIWRTLGQKAA